MNKSSLIGVILFEINTGNRTYSDYLQDHWEEGTPVDTRLSEEQLRQLTNSFDFGKWTSFCVAFSRKTGLFAEWRRNNLEHAATTLIQEADYQRVEQLYCSRMGRSQPLNREGDDYRFIWDLLTLHAQEAANGRLVLSVPAGGTAPDSGVWGAIARGIEERAARLEAARNNPDAGGIAPVADAEDLSAPPPLTEQELSINRMFAPDGELTRFGQFLDNNSSNDRSARLASQISALANKVQAKSGQLRLSDVDAMERAGDLHTVIAYGEKIREGRETASNMRPPIPEGLYFAKLLELFESQPQFALGNVRGVEGRARVAEELELKVRESLSEITLLAADLTAAELARDFGEAYSLVLQTHDELAARSQPFALLQGNNWARVSLHDLGRLSKPVQDVYSALSLSKESPWKLALNRVYYESGLCLKNFEILDQIHAEVVGEGERQIPEAAFRAVIHDSMNHYDVMARDFGGVEDSLSIADWVREVCRGLSRRSELTYDRDLFGRVLLAYVRRYQNGKEGLALQMDKEKSKKDGYPVIDIQSFGSGWQRFGRGWNTYWRREKRRG